MCKPRSLIPQHTLSKIKDFLDRESCADETLCVSEITEEMMEELNEMEIGNWGKGLRYVLFIVIHLIRT